jgi:hypothetical protein
MKLLKKLCSIAPFLNFVLCISGCSWGRYDGLTDLTFIYHTIQENHPGMHNILDPSFNDHLNAAYHVHAARLKNQPHAEQQAILTEFIKTFNDNHLALAWNNAPSTKKPSPSKVFSIREVATHTVWITLPTFYNLSKEQQEVFDTMLTKLPSWAKDHTIIFDIRTNGGGSSYYGDQIVNQLFGSEYAAQQRSKATANESVDWRASAHNVEYFSKVIQTLPTEQQAGLAHIVEGIRSALAEGKPLYHQAATKRDCQPYATTHTVTSRVICIIDQSNGSAALDFLDSITMMEYPITLIGKTTGADRLYMEVHPIELPSKTGNLWIPIKVYRDRFRGDNVPYTPHIPYEGDMADTTGLQTFVLDIVTHNI